MAQEKVKDMTEGAPLKLIIGFAVPMFLGLLFQQFYSMVDTIIVGKYLGVNALAAVGSTGSINFMINGFCIGVCSGFAIPVAQKFGARDYSGLRRFVANAAWLSIGVSVVLTAAVSVLCMDILVWMKTPEDIIQEAYSYIFIIFLGIPTTFLYNMTSGIIRSLGDSKTPVYFLLMASVLNIFLDLFMIIVMKMGPAGAAYATVISQGVSGVLCFFFMRAKYQVLKMSRDEMRINKHLMAVLCGMGFPMGFQYSITAIGNVILQTAVNSLGSLAVAAVTAGSRVSMFFCTPFDALGGTMATWAGQNVGAGKIDRIKEGVRYANLIGFVYSVLAFVILFFFGKQISLLFVDAGETEILNQAWMYLVANSLFYIPLVLVNVMRFAIQGMGYSTFAIIAGVCEMVGRSLVGFVLVPIFGYVAACIGSPVAWIFADFFLVPAFYHCVKRMKKRLGQ
ncbi:MAG: MATE family efflux transporter [Lachnospiraceae bacterium]